MRLYDDADFEKLKLAGHLAFEVLEHVSEFVQEGITTLELDKICHDYIVSHGAIPACVGYRGYKYATCISINHVICHGIPSNRKLCNGDILNIDVTVILDGFYGDTSRMYTVGKISNLAKKLIDVTKRSLEIGIENAIPGNKLGDLGHAIQSFVEKNGFSVVRDYCGHGTGIDFHMEPTILHYGKPNTGREIVEGMVFTIEPMINAGGYRSKLLSDGWTAITADHSLSAQFEHTLGITKDGPVIFTI